MKIGIMGAMPQEIDLVVANLGSDSTHRIANRTYHVGRFEGVESVIVFSRWGKVAASSTATTLIERFGVDMILFTGVAGGVSEDVNVGDVVIANKLLQHDFDVSPTGMFAKFEIPLLGISHFSVSESLVNLGVGAATEYLAAFDLEHSALQHTPKAVVGTIASGDQFIASPDRLTDLQLLIPDLKAVEMEGAAVAQVCHEYAIPCLVIRTISDKADHSAPMDFITFIQDIARHYSIGILKELVPKLAKMQNTN